MLVVKGHRFESEDCFARLVHRLDLLLETRRGRGDAEVTTVIYDDRYAGRHRHTENAGDKSVLVSWSRADANRGGLRGAGIANVDIIIDDGEIYTGIKPTAMLLLPLPLNASAYRPTAVLAEPVVLNHIARSHQKSRSQRLAFRCEPRVRIDRRCGLPQLRGFLVPR